MGLGAERLARLITFALVLLGALPATAAAAVEEVAAPDFGSSEPTYFSGNHRAAVTAGGRTLIVHGRHASGVQLAWRDPGGAWRRATTGATPDGSLLAGAGTGDIPASIAVAVDELGNEHAWVVWGGQNSDSNRAVQMRRLTALDSPAGPTVGPVVTVDAAAGGAYRPDLGFERGVDGSRRAYIVWTRDAGGGVFELRTAWFEALDTNTPVLNAGDTLYTGPSASVFGTVVPGPNGASILARANSRLTLYGHDAESAAGDWSELTTGPSIPFDSAPSGVALNNGDILAAVESAAGTASVYRFEADDAFDLEGEIELTGYAQPTLAGNGAEAWLVAVRQADGRIVSRRRSGAGGTWDVGDRVEIGPEGGDYLAWPNAVRETDGRLRLLVEGDGTTVDTSSVLAYERQLPGTPPLPAGFVEETIAEGMNVPTGMAVAPDGRIFVAEKAGYVRVVTPAGDLRPAPVLDLTTRVNDYSDRGLLGIAVDKDFATNGYLYLLYSYELQPMMADGPGAMVSRLTRVTVNPDNTLANPSNPETPILGKDVSGPCPNPGPSQDCIPSDHYWHSIGTVRVDPVDGTLWVGSGDAHPHEVDSTSYRPYDESNYAGKIIHVDRNGRGLPGHSFCPAVSDLDRTCTKIYAKGFRNPFRFTLRPGKGPIVADVGAADQEELDLVEPGQNYGWPCYEGAIRTPLYDQEPRCQEEYAKEGTADAASPPAWSYGHVDGGSIIAGPAYAGSGYPAGYTGDIFVGDYAQGFVKRLEVSADDRVTEVKDFATPWTTGVDLQALPGTGDIAYVDLGFGGREPAIRAFRYVGGANSPPTAIATADPSAGVAPLTVAFAGSGSTDPDEHALTYSWDFGDGATSTAADPTYTYETEGTYTATLTVDDDNGGSDTDSVQVTVGDAPPTARIDAPLDDATYRAGQPVSLRGAGSDPEDGTLTGGSLRWDIVLHHSTHQHPQSALSGAQTSFTPQTDHDLDSYYEITLTATDSAGLTAEQTIEVRPEAATLRLQSSPPGAPIDYADDATAPAPFTKTTAVGFRPSVSAADTFTVAGVTYGFTRWSDGGARQHQIDVPEGDTTLTAEYEPVEADRLVFTPDVDTWVDEGNPGYSGAGSSRLAVDASPGEQSFLRFQLAGLTGRTVENVWLRMYQRDNSPVGGRVFSISPSAWSATTTWATRPNRTLWGPQRGAFGPVVADNWYEALLAPETITGDGPLSFALDTTSTDGSVWGSSDFGEKPQLIVDLAPDETAPVTTIGSGPTGTSASNDPAFGFGSDTAGSTFECRLDGPGAATGSWGTCTAPRAYTDLSEGAYTFRVRATDGAGNTDLSPATRSFTVDTTAPQTTIGGGPSSTTASNDPAFDFTSNEPGSTFECRLDGPGAATGGWAGCSSPRAYPDLADGAYTFQVRATDGVGNTDGSPASRSFAVDTSSPPRDTDPPPGDTDPPPGDTDPPPGDTDPPPGDTDPPPGDTDPPPGDTDPPPGNTDPPPGDTDPPDEGAHDRRVRCRLLGSRISENRRVLHIRLTACVGNRAARSGRVRAYLRRPGSKVVARDPARMRRGRGQLRLSLRKPLRQGRYELGLRAGEKTVRWTVWVRRTARGRWTIRIRGARPSRGRASR